MSKRPPLRPGATRRAYINRTTKPKSSGRPKPRNAKRKAKEFARAYGSVERVEFVKSLGCAVCFIDGHTENAHVGNGGMSRKADAAKIVPLCGRFGGMPGHHELLHAWGREFFEQTYALDLDALAVETEAKWQAHTANVSDA